MTVERRADLKYIAKQIGSKRLSFASDEELVELLKANSRISDTIRNN